MKKKLTDKYIKTVCKIGQKSKCCKYLTFGPQLNGETGFFCAKKTKSLRAYIDLWKDMVAQGDNCNGR